MKITTLEEYQKLHDSDVDRFFFYVSSSRLFLDFRITRDGKTETFAVPFAQIPSIRLELGSQPSMNGRRYYGSIIMPFYYKDKKIVEFNYEHFVVRHIEPDDDVIYPASAVDDRIWLGNNTVIYTPAGEGKTMYNRIIDVT